MRDVEERAEQVLAAAPGYIWDGERLPVPIEEIVDSVYGLLVATSRTCEPPPAPRHSPKASSGLLLPSRGEIWVNAEEARLWPPRRRFTIGHELGYWVMHRTRQQALFCRRTLVDERAAPPGRDIEEEASAFAAGLLMPQWRFVREHARCRGDVAELGRTFGTSAAASSGGLQPCSAADGPPRLTGDAELRRLRARRSDLQRSCSERV